MKAIERSWILLLGILVFPLAEGSSTIPPKSSQPAAGSVRAAPTDSVFSNERRVTKLADGIYTIRHRDPFPGWVHGNTTVIIGTREVLVVDSCQLSDCAREDIAQIRQWTNLPVHYLLDTHWHLDHTGGNSEYADAFPALAIIAHSETKKMMGATSAHLSQMMLKDATTAQARLSEFVETGRAADGKTATEADINEARRKLAAIDSIVDQARTFKYQGPSLVFDGEMSVDIGNREVQIKYLGRGNTAGDAVVYLASEKIVVVGDLLDHPIPYAFDGYPSEWVETLSRIAQLDAVTIVPGHGEVLRDKRFLYQVIDLMKYIIAEVNDGLNRDYETPLDDIKKTLNLKTFRQSIAGDDKDNGAFFDGSIGSSFVELAYHEAKQR
jgi:cyclase